MIPRFAGVRRTFRTPRHPAPEAAVAAAAQTLSRGLRARSKVAIACGSRGISQIQALVRAAATALRDAGHEPFVLTAMGSHGGGTCAGQRDLLASYGIIEENVGAPVVANMDVREVGRTARGVPAYLDSVALEADAVLLLNRVKPHTTLRGDLGSGLMKMAAIGLGNHVGAESLHRHGLQRHLVDVARVLVAHSPIRGGIAVIENAAGEIAFIEAVAREVLFEREPELLARARALMPSIPFDPLDALVICYLGKNISGTGMDPNIIGMHRRHGGEAERTLSTVVALDLTDESHGNATGIGMADITTSRLRDRIDWNVTRTNCITGNFLAGLKLPLLADSDREAIEIAARLHGPEARMCIVRDTLTLDRLAVSESLLTEAQSLEGTEIVSPPAPLAFSSTGALDARLLDLRDGPERARYGSPEKPKKSEVST